MKKVAMVLMVCTMLVTPGCIKNAKLADKAADNINVDFSSSTANVTGVIVKSTNIASGNKIGSDNTVVDLTSSTIASGNKLASDNTLIVSSGAFSGNTVDVKFSSAAVNSFMDNLFEHMEWYHWILFTIACIVIGANRKQFKKVLEIASKWRKF